MFISSFVGRLFSKVPAYIQRAMSFVGPLIEAQLEEEKKHGKDWPEKTVRRGFSVI
jgi:hypothetical protein